jgi:hypothetical protein
MGDLINDEYPVLSCVLWIAFLAAIAFIIRELLFYGLPLVSAMGHAGFILAPEIIKAFLQLGIEGGAAVAGSLIAAAGVPFGVIVIYKFIAKTEEKRKAWIVAIGIFLYPIFVDFFKDELPKMWWGREGGGWAVKIAISIVFATIFMVATKLYNKSNWLSKLVAGALYSMPLFIMIGYLVRYQHPTGVIPFLSNLGMVEKLGLAGLILTALFGMYLSRTNSVEA